MKAPRPMKAKPGLPSGALETALAMSGEAK